MARIAKTLSGRAIGEHIVILVTVGTTMPFDELLAEVDRLAEKGFFEGTLLVQSGQSKYRMRHGEQFVGRPGLQDLIDQSDMVITHGGATVIQLLLSGKPFVAFPNPRAAGDHQTAFLCQVSEVMDISWSRDVADLERLCTERRKTGPARNDGAFPKAASLIENFARHKKDDM